MAPPPASIPRPRWRRAAGTTLLEILLVLAILAIVIGILIGPSLYAKWRDAQVRTTRLVVQEYAHGAYPQWALSTGQECPDSLEQLRAYANSDPRDSWGSALDKECVGSTALPPDQMFGVLSIGRDKQRDTSDDILSWKN